jgi:hypothetical protein
MRGVCVVEYVVWCAYYFLFSCVMENVDDVYSGVGRFPPVLLESKSVSLAVMVGV